VVTASPRGILTKPGESTSLHALRSYNSWLNAIMNRAPFRLRSFPCDANGDPAKHLACIDSSQLWRNFDCGRDTPVPARSQATFLALTLHKDWVEQLGRMAPGSFVSEWYMFRNGISIWNIQCPPGVSTVSLSGTELRETYAKSAKCHPGSRAGGQRPLAETYPSLDRQGGLHLVHWLELSGKSTSQKY